MHMGFVIATSAFVSFEIQKGSLLILSVDLLEHQLDDSGVGVYRRLVLKLTLRRHFATLANVRRLFLGGFSPAAT